MFLYPPDLVRTVHDDRRHAIFATADAQRPRREVPRTERPVQRVRAAVARLAGVLRRDRNDGKIERLMASWMMPDRAAATVLAASADILDVEPGTVFAADRFTYLALKGGAGVPLVIEPGSRSVTVTEGATMLVLPTSEVDDFAHAIPALDAALQKHRSERTASPPEPIAVERPDHCKDDRHRPCPRSTPPRATTRRDRSPSTSSSAS
jgi:hypothetical protein